MVLVMLTHMTEKLSAIQSAGYLEPRQPRFSSRQPFGLYATFWENDVQWLDWRDDVARLNFPYIGKINLDPFFSSNQQCAYVYLEEAVPVENVQLSRASAERVSEPALP